MRLYRLLALLAAFTLIAPALAADKPLVMEAGKVKQLPAATTLQLNASGTGAASINIPQGTAPTSPTNGDCWTTTGGLFCRINGGTVGPYGTGTTSGGLVAANNLSDVASASTSRTNLGLGTIATEDEATAAQIQAATASKAVAADKLIASAAPQTLTDGATINWDLHAGFNAKVTLGGNRTFAAPTNPHEGMTYRLEVIQDGTGSRTATWPSAFDFGAAGTPTLSTTAAKHDFIYLDCYDAATPKFRATFNKAS